MSVIGNTALRFDDEQAMLLDVAQDFCRRHGVATAREHLETPLAHDPAQWEEIVGLGWTGIGISDEVGGSGLDISAGVPVLESMGRALLGTPLLSSLLAGQLLQRAAGDEAADVLAAIAGGAIATVADLESEDWLAPTQASLDGDGCVQGAKRMVTDAMQAQWFVVTVAKDDEPALALVSREALADEALQARVLIDLTKRAADVSFDGVEAAAVYGGPGVAAAIRDYRLIGALLVAAESAGAAATCLDTIVDYLKTRKQFGRLIGSYQALKHPSVDMLTALDSSRSFIYHAATLVSDAPLGADEESACRMAKAQATETLRYAGDRAVQFHGGMGFTWDCDAQLFLRRAQWAQQQFGDAVHHRQRLAGLLLDS